MTFKAHLPRIRELFQVTSWTNTGVWRIDHNFWRPSRKTELVSCQEPITTAQVKSITEETYLPAREMQFPCPSVIWLEDRRDKATLMEAGGSWPVVSRSLATRMITNKLISRRSEQDTDRTCQQPKTSERWPNQEESLSEIDWQTARDRPWVPKPTYSRDLWGSPWRSRSPSQ